MAIESSVIDESINLNKSCQLEIELRYLVTYAIQIW